MKRRDLLRAGAALPAVAAGAAPEAEAKKQKPKKGTRSFAGKNVVLFITDQERAIQHFPKGWADENLPGARRLERNGLTFNRAFCNACMCSPSRATLFTGYFPAQHEVKYTLEENMSPPDNPQAPLPLPDELANLATVMEAAGYQVPYKGKFHLTKKSEGPNGDWVPDDVNQYGFSRWDPPDAGANQDIDQFGGGDPDNDGRFMDDKGPVASGREGVIEFLKSDDAKAQPFFLIVSLVNPHDVLSYPLTYDAPGAGYNNSDLRGDIGLPATAHEDLSTKPTAQKEFLLLSVGLGPLDSDEKKTNYVNFYGNLMKESDAYLVDILDTLEDEDLLDDTVVIKTSDHGEMGTAHGGQRQKCFNFYEETLRVPLVFSNPKLYRKAQQSDALVSHVDFLPTMATLLEAPQSARQEWQGVDYSTIVRRPKKKKGAQDYIVFTYDDIQVGQPDPPYVEGANHIVSIREGRYKLAKYFDEAGVVPDQWEMYDLKHDPLEQRNLAYPGAKLNKKQKRQLQRLMDKLAEVEQTRLQPL